MKNIKEEKFPKKYPKISNFLDPKQVGRDYPKLFTYQDCSRNEDGYIDPKKFLPLSYDLVYIKVEREGKRLSNIFSGWWTGQFWDGKSIKDSDIVISWKRKEEINDH